MRLTVPPYRLKRRARLLSRKENVPLSKALDRVAAQEGFSSWSLLAARASKTAAPRALLAHLQPGDLVLLAARPGHGKTLMSLEIMAEAIKQGRRGMFFTLEFTLADVVNRLRSIELEPVEFEGRFECDDSNEISAETIMRQLANTPRGTVAVVDYLQLLDQKRENPELSVQVQAVKAFARKTGLIIVMISQIDRSFDVSAKAFPDLDDVRSPNPLDLTLFNKTCFMNDGEIQLNQPG